VLSVDDVMKSALAALRTNSEAGLKSMQEAFVQQMMSMQQMISKQTEQLTSQMNQMPQLLQRMDEISTIPSKLDKLLDRIEKSNGNLVKQMVQSMKSIPTHRDGAISKITSKFDSDSYDSQNPLIKWIIVGVLGIIALVLIANLTVNILAYNSNGTNDSNDAIEPQEVLAEPQVEVSFSNSKVNIDKNVQPSKESEPVAEPIPDSFKDDNTTKGASKDKSQTKTSESNLTPVKKPQI